MKLTQRRHVAEVTYRAAVRRVFWFMAGRLQ